MSGQTVSISLGANTAGAVSGLKDLKKVADSLTSSIANLGDGGVLQLVSGITSLVNTVQNLRLIAGQSVAVISGIGAAFYGASKIVDAYSERLAAVTEQLESLKALGRSNEAIRSSASNVMKGAIKDGLMSGEEMGIFELIMNDAQFMNKSAAASEALIKITKDLRGLLEVRGKLAKLTEAQAKANLATTQSDFSFGVARGALADAEISGSNLSPEDEAVKRIEVLNEIHKRKLREFEQLEIAANKRVEDAKRKEDELTTIAEESSLATLVMEREASWVKLSADETVIRNTAREKRRQLDLGVIDEINKKERERLDLLEQEKRIIEQVFRVERERIDGSFRMTEVQKRSAKMKSFDDQLALDPTNEKAAREKAFLGETADPNSVLDQTQKSTVDFFNQIGTLAQSVGQLAIAPMVGMFEGMQTSIKGLLMGTMSWNQALVGVGRAILSSVISAFTQLIAKAILLFGLVTLLNVIAPGLGSALGSLMGVGSGVASGGGGKSFNPGASGNAGYAAGGYTGDGDRFSPAGIVHRGEYVMPQSAVSRIGVPNLEAMKAGAAPIGGGPNVHFAAFNSHQAAQQWAESRDGRTYLVDMMSQVVQEARA